MLSYHFQSQAFGIESIYGQALQKLVAFMKDIGGGASQAQGN